MAQFNGTSGNDMFQNVGGGGSLVLVLSGTSAEGGIFPRITVLVDGQAVAGASNVEISVVPPATQTVVAPVPSGATRVAIHYGNDEQSSWTSGDRDLYIKSVTLNGVDLPPSTAMYDRTVDGQFHSTIQGQAEMKWSGTLTFSGAAVANAAASGGAGTNDIFSGGAGVDTVVFSGGHAEYGVIRTSTGWSVTHGSEADALVSVERLQFSDHKVALDVDGNAGWTVKIISALFGAQWAASPSIVGVGIGILDAGMSPQALVQALVSNPGFGNLSGSNETFVRTLYQNLTGSTASQQFVDTVLATMDSGQHTKASIGLIAAGLVGVPDTGIIYA
jgi:hypothetical protein